MKKLSIYSLIIGSAITLISGCSSVTNKLADMEIQKKQLANGRTVFVDFNVTPTPSWNCKEVGTRQSYDWMLLQTQGQFTFSGAHGLLVNKAIAYANQQNLNPNYINLQIPTEKTFTKSHGRSITSTILNRKDQQAIASYYQCVRINPQHKIGWEKSTDLSVRVGK